MDCGKVRNVEANDLQNGLLIATAVFFFASAVYWARNVLVVEGTEVKLFFYQLVAIVVVWLAMWLPTKPPIDALRKRKNESDG